jgi:hypothetical protein
MARQIFRFLYALRNHIPYHLLRMYDNDKGSVILFALHSVTKSPDVIPGAKSQGPFDNLTTADTVVI